jgi:hypothetical protein
METASWTLKLEDAEGLVGGQDDRISVHVSPDPPPSVVLERPPIDQYVTPEASVSFSVAVKDNLAVREITLASLRSDQSDQDRQRIELYRGPAEPPRITAESLAAIESDRRHVDYVWELAPLGLAPGTFLAVHAEAGDYQGQLGQTLLPRNIHIVSVADLEARLAEQQDILLGELERALQLERDARRDVGGVQVQLAEVGTLAQREVDVLQAVEINQRHIAELLADRAEGIPGRIAALRGDLAANRIESPDIHRRLDELDAALGNLATEHLSVIQHELTSALKTVGSSDVDKERLGQTIASAAEHQDAVIESLAALLGDFSRWSDYRRFARDISQLRADQQQIAQTVREEIGLDQLHVESSELTAQQRADREKVVERQLELARRLESLQQQMDRTVAELTAADPLAATTLADALDAARRNAVDRHMREAADHVGRNQIGRSLDALAHVDEALREVLDILRDTRGGELRRLVSKLREAEEDLRALEEQAAGIVSKMDAAQGQESPDKAGRELQRLLREQQELRQEVQQMSRRLLRLTADLAARSAARAAEQLAPGGQSGAGAAEDAGRERVRASEQDLEQAQAELAAAREQAEADLVAEQLADMQTTLSSLATRQERVVDETARLDAARQSSGEWSLGQLQSLASAAKEEELLHEETAAAAEAMLELGVVRTALAMAAREMATAATGLAGRNTGPDTQRAGRAALVRLRMVLEALGDQPAPDADSQATDAAGASGEGGESQAGEEPNAIDVAELRLLKLMQLDLRERTAAAEAALAASGEQRPKAEAEYAELAVEQSQMATLVSQLLDQAAEGQNNEDAILPSLEDALEQDEALPDIDF